MSWKPRWTPHTQLTLAAAVAVGVAALSHGGEADARRIASSRPPVVAPERATYSLELVGEHGAALPTFRRGSRFYVLGDAGERYSIRVTNPTARRIEAVVSVDGLDVIDGESASLAKRGYVVMPFSSVDIDGFRVSTEEVAAFRFSSVADSYAGRKGKARHVGVIGLAVFEEKAPVAVVLPREEIARSKGAPRRRPAAEPAPAPATSSADKSAESESRRDDDSRAGLGTEFGEHRSSAVTMTTFERVNAKRPQARAELRYNDASGLRALGIRIRPEVDVAEIETRESADPFPADGRFARPPR